MLHNACTASVFLIIGRAHAHGSKRLAYATTPISEFFCFFFSITSRHSLSFVVKYIQRLIRSAFHGLLVIYHSKGSSMGRCLFSCYLFAALTMIQGNTAAVWKTPIQHKKSKWRNTPC